MPTQTRQERAMLHSSDMRINVVSVSVFVVLLLFFFGYSKVNAHVLYTNEGSKQQN